MTTTTSRPPDRPSSPRNEVPSPFESNFHLETPDFSIEAYIKKQIEAIFYANKKMDLQAKIEVYWKATEQKTLQLTSCSIVYSIIRDTVERIAWKLRQLVDNSYAILTQHKRSWSKMSPTSVSWSKNWLKFKEETDQPYLLFVYPPLANYYNMLYKHLCDSAKEVYSLWKIMYECIPIKDLKCETFQQSISELILDIFTIPTKTFEPKRMLPIISLANKCQFVKAEVQNSCKRMEYTKFQQDQMARNLIETSNRRFRTLGMNLQQFAYLNRHNNDSTINNSSKRLDRSKIDHRFLSELSKLYIGPQKQSEVHLVKHRSQSESIPTLFEHQRISLGPEVKAELLDTFEGNAELIYELQDTSSQEDDLHTYYASGNSSNKDELIEENQEIQVQLYPFQDRLKENQTSAKLSSSTGIDETNDNHDLSIIKNYQFENPPDFILQDDLNTSDIYQNEEKHDQTNFQISQKYITKIENGKEYTHEIKVIKKQNYEEHHITFNVDKSKKKIAKQHDRHPKDRSKCYMQYENEKLQKYRKELEKEKQDLLKEVQRFVMEKEKDEHIYKLINEKLALKNSRRPKNQYKFNQQVKAYDFNRNRPSLVQDQDDLVLTKQQIAERIQNQKLIGLKTSEAQLQEIQLLEAKTLSIEDKEQEKKQDKCSDTKISKRQQKLRKKVERQMKEIKGEFKAQVQTKQQPKQIISEKEMELNHFLENLNVSKSNRVPWHIEESRLQRWKMKIHIIRSKSIKECPIPESNKIQQATGKSSKKKKKNRH